MRIVCVENKTCLAAQYLVMAQILLRAHTRPHRPHFSLYGTLPLEAAKDRRGLLPEHPPGADEADPDTERGWSVMVTGPAEVLTDGEVLVEARELPLRPWAGDADAFVRIGAVMVSGRRIG